MSASPKKTPAEELIESLLSDVKPSKSSDFDAFHLEDDEGSKKIEINFETVIDPSGDAPDLLNLETNILKSEQEYDAHSLDNTFSGNTKNSYEATRIQSVQVEQDLKTKVELLNLDVHPQNSSPIENDKKSNHVKPASVETMSIFSEVISNEKTQMDQKAQPHKSPTQLNENERTIAIENNPPLLFGKNDSMIAIDQQLPDVKTTTTRATAGLGENDKTVAVTGFQIKIDDNIDDKVKVSVGMQSRSAGFASWGGGSVDGNLGQADNLRIAQEKILDLENENEKIRRHNEELRAATEIIKERCDLLTSQVTEFKNDRDGLEESFKNEMTILKNHLNRKEAELQKAQFKVDELESRLKFDMKKIRVRERELENRLELVRAEKNAVSKNKDEQILDLRRKMDTMQMEVDSYRQKCVELNKQIESSQESFKRTTRALRLAMANLELQEENKSPLKKAE